MGCFHVFSQNGPGYRYSCAEQNLISALNEISATYGLYFSYPLDLVEGKTIAGSYEGETLDQLLGEVLQGQGIRFERVDEQFVVLSEKEAVPRLWRLCGTVLDSGSTRPLAYASIYDPITGKGVNADRLGSFVFEIKEGEIDSLLISYAGYQPRWVKAQFLANQACKDIWLLYRNQTETGVLITEYLSDGVALTENGAATLLELNRMAPLPGQTDADALRSLRFLPGISSPQGELSQLFVRGGTPDQNLIAWEGIPIYQTAYYFGMISAFNPDFIDQIKVYRGGFGPEFSNRVSGVIDLSSQTQLSDSLRIGARVDGLLAAFTGHIPLAGQRLNLSLSLRRSISDLWPSPTFQQLSLRAQQDVRFEDLTPFNQNPRLIFDPDLLFRDGQFKLTWQASKKDELSWSALANENRFGIYLADTLRNSTRQDSLRVTNRGMSLVWRRAWAKGWSTQLSTLFSGFNQYYRYQFRQIDTLSDRQVSFRNSDLLDIQAKASIQYQSPQGWRLLGGYQFHQYELAYQLEEARNGNSNLEQAREQDARLHGAYLSFKSREDHAWGYELGLRLNGYPGLDSTFLGPRAGLWYHFGSVLTARANLGRYHQFLTQLLEFQGQAVGLSIPVWILAQPPEPGFVPTPPQISDQIQVGLLAQLGTWVF
ncbi:MAG: TonB-dependent receptor, partial [Bacteroidota bacterium]